MFKKLIQAASSLLALMLLSTAAAAQQPLLTITWEVDSFFNHDCTTTLYDDGTIRTEVDWAPDPDDTSIPADVIPDGADPESVDIEKPMTQAEAEKVIRQKITSYLIGEWTEEGIDKLKNKLKKLFGWAKEQFGSLKEWLTGLYGDLTGGKAVQALQASVTPPAADSTGANGTTVANPDPLDGDFNRRIANGVMEDLIDWYQSN